MLKNRTDSKIIEIYNLNLNMFKRVKINIKDSENRQNYITKSKN